MLEMKFELTKILAYDILSAQKVCEREGLNSESHEWLQLLEMIKKEYPFLWQKYTRSTMMDFIMQRADCE